MLKLPKKLHPDFAFPEKKPVGKVQIDRDNFFGRSAVFCNAGSGTDVADGSLVRLKMARLNPSASPRVHTGDLYFYADHGGSDDDELESVQTDLPTLKTVLRQTLMVRFVPTYYNANSHTICHNTLCLGFYIQLNPSGTHRIGYYGNNGFNYYGQFSADKIVEHKLNTIAISVDGVSKKLSLYVNGHRLADAGVVVGSVGNIGEGTISSYDKLLFSNSGYTNYYHFKGRLTQVALFHDYFSEDQLAQLAIDPYQILKPANDLFYFPAAGGGPSTKYIAATGLSSADAYGLPSVQLSTLIVAAQSLSSAEAFGSVSIQRGAVTLLPLGIASAEGIGQVSILVGAQNVHLSSITTAEAFGLPSLVSGSVSVQLTGISSSELLGLPSVRPPDRILSMSAIPSAFAAGLPLIEAGTVTVRPVSLDDGNIFGLPTVRLDKLYISPVGIFSGMIFGKVVIVGGDQVLISNDYAILCPVITDVISDVITESIN